MKRLSIIVPVYNVERYLGDCLRSVVNHRDAQVEILLVDDGSTDRSGAMCDEFARLHGNVHAYHKENGGLSDARNFGLARATGEYVLFLDADDFLAEGAVEDICAELESGQMQMLAWNAGIVEESGAVSEKDARYYQHAGLEDGRCYTGMQLIDAELRHHGDYATVVWLGAYRRDFLLENGFWFEKGLLHEDELWTQKVLLNCDEIRYVDRVFYEYRKREGSIMAQTARDCSRNLEVWMKIHAKLTAYCDQRISDGDFRRRLRANLAKRYLHAVAKYGPRSAKETLRKIDKRTILRDARGRLDRMRAIVLCVDVRLYCRISAWLKREASE